MARNFKELSEREIMALAISLEEEHSRIYGEFAHGLRESFPASAKLFDEMEHRNWLIETFRERFGEHIPLIRRQDVKGFVQHRPVWLVQPLGLNVVRRQASVMELEVRRFYDRALTQVTDAGIRKLLGDLALAER
ncbi:MAG: ferritin family protein, partial [Bryobacteraceae bacterium]